MLKRIYLDHSATTPMDPHVLDAMLPFFTQEFGNASSIHGFGRPSKVAIEAAREQVAKMINASPGEIIFTGSGTESDNLAIIGAAKFLSAKGKHIVTSGAEHHAVLHTFEILQDQSFEVTFVECDEFGMIRAETIEKAIRADTTLVSIMHVNNEVGTINPVDRIGALCRSRGILFHTDAVQSFGKLKLDVKEMNIDLLSASAHKLYGPKGVGMLYVKRGVKLEPMIFGGSQERGQRAGTENVPGIVGFGKAAELSRLSMDTEMPRLEKMRDRLWKAIHEAIPDARLNGHPELRLPGHLNISFMAIGGDEVLMGMDLLGIAISTGSACTSGAVTGSHVLKAMKFEGSRLGGAVRLTLGRHSQESDIPMIVKGLQDTLAQFKK